MLSSCVHHKFCSHTSRRNMAIAYREKQHRDRCSHPGQPWIQTCFTFLMVFFFLYEIIATDLVAGYGATSPFVFGFSKTCTIRGYSSRGKCLRSRITVGLSNLLTLGHSYATTAFFTWEDERDWDWEGERERERKILKVWLDQGKEGPGFCYLYTRLQ